MKSRIGLDVSQKTTVICVVDSYGECLREGACANGLVPCARGQEHGSAPDAAHVDSAIASGIDAHGTLFTDQGGCSRPSGLCFVRQKKVTLSGRRDKQSAAIPVCKVLKVLSNRC